MARIPGVVDVRIAEPLDYPSLQVKVDRDQGAASSASPSSEVASSLLSLLSSAQLVAAELLARPDHRRQLQRHLAGAAASVRLGRRAAEHSAQLAGTSVDSAAAAATPAATAAAPAQPQLLGNLATVSHDVDPAVVTHYNVQRVIDVDCNVSGRDLGGVTKAVQQADRPIWASCPPGTQITIRGQSQAMNAVVRHAWRSADSRDRAGVPADGREFPVVARTAHHHDGGAGRARGRALDAGAHAARRSTSSR